MLIGWLHSLSWLEERSLKHTSRRDEWLVGVRWRAATLKWADELICATFTWQMGCVGAEYGRIFRVSRFRFVIPAENSALQWTWTTHSWPLISTPRGAEAHPPHSEPQMELVQHEADDVIITWLRTYTVSYLISATGDQKWGGWFLIYWTQWQLSPNQSSGSSTTGRAGSR